MLLENNISEDNLSAAWKYVSNQSERQLGAFVFLYVQEFGKSPILLNNTSTQFRNEVIHKGKIPTKAEALKYGQSVLDVMRPIIAEAKVKYPNGVQKTILQHIMRSRGNADDGTAVATMNIPTIVSLTVSADGYEERSLEKEISELLRW